VGATLLHVASIILGGFNMSKKKTKRQQSMIPETRPKVDITPITKTQESYINEIKENDVTFGIGPAGTGKTFLATKMAMYYLTEGLIDRIVICRPAVNAGGEQIGFLPGDITSKMDPYVRPIIDTFLTYWSKPTIEDYIYKSIIEIAPLAYMRGRTFEYTFIVADEMENASNEQMLMLLTRLGKGSKMVITGDPRQKDIATDTLYTTINKIGMIEKIGYTLFNEQDVVRHSTVRKILNYWFTDDVPNSLGKIPRKMNGNASDSNHIQLTLGQSLV
jgi:phosphate starvation-inducible protein PhoH and related proteins